ncbi:Chitinase 4 [Diaporthe eres]
MVAITPLNANEQQAAGISGNGANAEVTVTRIVTVIRTIDGVPEQTSDNGVTETVTVTSTETSTVTVQPPPETKIADLTEETQESSSPEPAVPSPPIVHPHYGNTIQPVPYGNSSSPSSNSSSGLPPIPVLPKPSSAVGVEPYSEYALPVPSGYENSIYFTNWSVNVSLVPQKSFKLSPFRGIYGANYQPQSIPASKITRVYYAFASFGSDGRVTSSDPYADLQKHYSTDSWNDVGNNAYGCVKQLYLLKKQNRQLKVILSIGGWNDSPKFPAIAASATARETFARSAVKLVTDWGFDGIDLDWEYPEDAAQAADFVKLLAELRKQLSAWTAANARGYRLLLTVASSAGPDHYNVLDLREADRYLDSWNLMAYDYAGSWDTTAGHQANLFANAGNPGAAKYSTDKAVTDYVARGVPASKILLGLPTYGRAFESTDGLGKPFYGVGPGSATLQTPGLWLYKDLPRPGAGEQYDEIAGASWSYDPAARELISYDNVRSARVKASYLKGKGLAGSFFWEASGDKQGAQSLVGTLAEELGRLNGQRNLLSYPTSQYDNIRNGLPDA